MSEYIHKSHNVNILIYHFVCLAKYGRIVFSDEADKTLKETCEEIEKRYEIRFLEIGTDRDHVHFLVQSIPTYNVTKIIKLIKSITAKKIFEKHPEVKEKLWGGEFWSDGYYVGTVGKHGNEEIISHYVKNQGNEQGYKQLLKKKVEIIEQLSLFD